VDSHIHINEPGRTEWEGFDTATRAAALGGVTTLVDMPLNSIPPTTSVDAFSRKLESARSNLHVDVGFWGGVVPGNSAELAGLLDAGVLGFKCFMIDSGVEEFPPSSREDMERALAILASTDAPLLAHAELEGPILAATRHLHEADFRRYASFLASRPAEAEDEAVRLLAELAKASGAAVHVVHQASAGSLEIIEAAKNDGSRFTAETCPHYLHFDPASISDGATEFKCVPPIREVSHREALWKGLESGVLDCVVSDHSPCSPELKLRDRGDFDAAWGGISSIQLTLSVMTSEILSRGGSLSEIPRWMSERPAALAGLERKGSFAKGADADIVVWRPEESIVVKGQSLSHRHGVTPYDGETLKGRVEATYVRGQLVAKNGALVAEAHGRPLLGRG
jgi:allantoinase